MRDLREIAEYHQNADVAFNELPADASAEAIHEVALQLAPVMRQIHASYPSTLNPPRPKNVREREAMHALYQSLPDLYNPAQIDVLGQAYRLAQDDDDGDGAGA